MLSINIANFNKYKIYKNFSKVSITFPFLSSTFFLTFGKIFFLLKNPNYK